MSENEKFNILKVSSKIGICGVPLRADTYSGCSFGCKYCFSNNREIMGGNGFKIGNIKQLERLFNRVLVKGNYKNDNLLETLLANRFTIHCGGMSDPFQPCEADYKITSEFIDLTNEYSLPVLFSTKSNTVYGANINPKFHSFQLSVSNIGDNKTFEPNVPPFEQRLKFYKELKARGFKVGIRIQPFIPGVTEPGIIDCFKDADMVTIESIKLVPQCPERREELRKLIGLKKEDFYYFGLENIKPELKIKYYEPFIEKLKRNGIPFSIADNDMRSIGTEKCCCGDSLVSKSTSFNTTAMLNSVGRGYSVDDVLNSARNDGIIDCKCKGLFASNRQKNVSTVGDFIRNNFANQRNPMCPEIQFFPT